MKKVRNIIIAIAAVSLLLLLCFTIYFQISLSKANSAPIHEEASWVVKVDGVEIFKTLYADLLSGTSTTPLEDSAHFRIVNSITMPINVYIFNTPTDPAGFFTSFILQDEKILLNNLRHQNSWTVVDSTHKIFKNKQNNIYVTYNRKRLFFAWNIKEKSGLPILKDLAQETNFKPFNKSKFKDAFQEDKIVSATNLNEYLFLSSAQDSILINGHIVWKAITNQEVHLDVVEAHPTLSICVHKKGRIEFPNILTLDTNTVSFFNSFNNKSHINVALQMLDTSIKYAETEVSFEYDENFEQIKTTRTTEKKIPWIQFVYQEGENINVFKGNEGAKIDSKYFPYFPIYQVPFNALSNLATDKIRKKYTDTKCGFHIAIDINKVEHLEEMNAIKNILAPFKYLQLKGSVNKPNELMINGYITIDEQNQNALKTLYRQFKF